MNAAELKIKIFRQVDSMEPSKLEELYGVMLNYINSKRELDDLVGVNEDEIIGIKAAISELDLGKGISHEAVISKFKKKYSHA